MSQPIPVSVLGCGHLGTYHARLYHGLEEARLVMVADLREEKARQLGESLGVPWTTDPSEAVAAAEAVSIATPTVTHAALAAECFRGGRSVLVEKPLAATLEDGQAMVSGAEAAGLVLAVGHVERFNPAFRSARLAIGKPRFAESHRLSPFVPRSLDVDVVLDLMIHDIDLTLSLIDEEIESIDAIGVPVLTEGEDIASARIRFRGGAVANLTASRVSRDRTRKIRFFGARRYVSVDLMNRRVDQVILDSLDASGCSEPDPRLAREAAMAAAAAPPPGASPDQAALAAYFQARRLDLKHGSLTVEESNPLEDELKDFLGAVRGRALEGASGRAGLRSLEAALEIHRRVQESLQRLGLDAEAGG